MLVTKLLSMSRYADAAQAAAQAIADHGYALVRNFMPEPALAELRQEFERLHKLGAFRRAGIGAWGDFRTREDVRGDEISWIEPAEASPPVLEALAGFEALRVAVNSMLYLGLFDFECHFAQFPAGAGYRRHCDQLRKDDRRQLSVMLYLNENWRAEDGGALRLYLDDNDASQSLDLIPEGGSMIAFLSARFTHEVLPCMRQRRALTGWFKTRA